MAVYIEGQEKPDLIELVVQKMPQDDFSITGANLTYTYGDSPFQINTTGGSGTGQVTYESNHPEIGSISGNTVTLHKAGQFKITATKAADDIYDEKKAEFTVTVVPKQVTISGIYSNDKIYDGTETGEILGLESAAITGIIGDDNLNIDSSSAKALFQNKNAGSNKTVFFSGFKLGGADKDNYVLIAQPVAAHNSIEKRDLTITAQNQERNFGTQNQPFKANYDGFAPNENITNLSGILNFSCSAVSSSPAGEYPIVPSGFTSSNYNINYVNGTLKVLDTSAGNAGGANNNYTNRPSGGGSGGTSGNNNTNPTGNYPPFDQTDETTKVRVTAPSGVFSDDVKLITQLIEVGNAERDELINDWEDQDIKDIAERQDIYDIYLINSRGTRVQPAGGSLVTVYIPVKKDFDVSDLESYRIEKDKDVRYSSHIENLGDETFLVFETNHFSYYAMVDKDMNKVAMIQGKKKSFWDRWGWHLILWPLLLLLILLALLLWWLIKNSLKIKIAEFSNGEYIILAELKAKKVQKYKDKSWKYNEKFPTANVMFKFKKPDDLEINTENHVFVNNIKYNILNIESTENSDETGVLCQEVKER